VTRTIHLWIGLSLLVLLVPLGLSGSLLVWDTALDKRVHPARYAVRTGEQPPETYFAAARAAFAGRAVPAQLRMAQAPGLPVSVVGYAPAQDASGRRPPMRTAWLDPASGRVLDVGDPRGEWLGVIHRLHGNLLLTENGRPLVGWLGVAMLVMSLTGLWVWWPRGPVLNGLRWSRTTSTMSNLHHMVGFWIAIPLAVLSATGACIAFPKTLQALAGSEPAAARAPGPPRGGEGAFAPPLAAPRMSADAALAAARAVDPDLAQARLISISLPTAGRKPVWRVQFRHRDGSPVGAQVDDASGRATVEDGPQRDGPTGDPFMRLVRRIHEGAVWGPAWRIVVTLAGLAPTLLAVSGVAVWWRRRRRTRPAAS
jgi:uncharacterized iron-regulated membrane protein